LAFYFLFSLFPTLFSATAILGFAARSPNLIYDRLLHYLTFAVPTAALSVVLGTFSETTPVAARGTLTLGVIAAIWSASVGVSAIQDTLNVVYKVEDTRSYFRARIYAIGLTILLTVVVSLIPACILAGDVLSALSLQDLHPHFVAVLAAAGAKVGSWLSAAGLLALTFAITYYFAPDVEKSRWHWLTPGGAVAIVGWSIACVGFRVYLHFFNSFSVTYGSMGAVFILLTWFYMSGLMLLVGAEINSEIEAAAAEKRIAPSSFPAEDGGTQ
jgi:membrane protein